MNIDVFSQWLVRQGYSVYATESGRWFNAGPRVLQSFPFHRLIQPTEGELRNLLWSHGILALRYCTPLEAPRGKVSYHIELRHPYRLDLLKSHARNGVKKGRACFQVERIPLARLAGEGWLLQQDTLERQNRLNSMQQHTWRKICLAGEGLPGISAWGAIRDGELAGALLTIRIDDMYCVPYALSRSQHLHLHVNNILFFDASVAMLAEEGIQGIFFTMESLDAPPGVDEFKLRMSLTPRPVRQRIALHPLLRLLGTRPGYALIRRLKDRFPQNNAIHKAEGMLRFHTLAAQPLDRQEWPECIAQYRRA